MTAINKRRWAIIRDFWIGWTIAFMFLSIVRGVGTVELGAVKFEIWSALFVSLVFGLLFGGIAGLAQIYMEERVYKRTSIARLLAFRVAYAVLFLFTMIVLSYLMVTTFFGVEIGFVDFIFEPGSFPIYFYMITVDFILVLLRQINVMLGEKNLRKFLMGKFYQPREEERIFMFLDLRSSTTIAEKIGHLQYSKLMQDCFNDLAVVAENAAEIYQYVGDEAILTWNMQSGLRNQNCVRAFFTFKERLQLKKEHYKSRYGLFPEFKAGLNGGQVIVTEVGKYKKEIAYYGDVLNIAARIQGKCNELGKDILISETLKDQMKSSVRSTSRSAKSMFQFDSMGQIDLRGKEEGVGVWGVSFS